MTNRIMIVRITIIALLLLCSCSPIESEKPLRVGFNPWPGYEFIYLAEKKGFYQQQGISVRLVELNSLGDVRRAFERGQIDIMASTMVELLIATENTGRSINIIAVADASNGSDMLLAPKSTNSLHELKGKAIGVEGGTVDILVANAALASAGLSFQDVKVVGKTQDDLVADIEGGLIDAIQTYPPYSVRLLNTGKYQRLFDTSMIPGVIVDILSADTDVIKKREDDIQRFLTAYFQAFEYFEKHPKVSSEIMGKRVGLSGEEFFETTQGMIIFNRDAQAPYLNPDSKGGVALNNAATALYNTGWLKNTINVEDFFTNPNLN